MGKAVQTILIIEPDSLFASKEKRWLKNAGYNVIHTSNEKDAMSTVLLKSVSVSLILTEIMLKNRINGINTARKILSKIDVPLIFISSGFDRNTVALAEKINPYGFLSKDVKESVLIASVRLAFKHHNVTRNLKLKKEALTKSEDIFSSFMEYSPIYVFFKDEQTRSIRLSKNYEKMLGKPLPELLNKTMDELFPSDLAKEMVKDDLKVLKDGKVVQVIEELNGRHYETLKFPILEKGKPKFLAGFTIDITERKKFEEAVSHEQYLLNSLINFSPDRIYFKNLRSKFIRISKALAERFNLKDPKEAEGKTDFDFFSEEHARQAFNDEQKIIRTGEPVIGLEEKETWPDGHVTWVFSNKLPLIDEEGKIIGTFGISRDITERKNAEEQLQKYTEELKILNSTKDKFFSIIAHDLKNPFHSINGSLEFLISDFDSFDRATIMDLLMNTLNTSRKAYSLLENLLQWSLHQMNKISFQPEEIELKEIIKENINLFKESAKLKKITLVEFIDAGIKISADRNMLNTILRNLIGNAIKFTPDDGTVRIESKIKREVAEVIIEDNGVGILPENIEKLFKIDQSFTTSGTRNETGTGLGLILCKEFAEMNKGKFTAESSPGKGSKFSFTLPLIY